LRPYPHKKRWSTSTLPMPIRPRMWAATLGGTVMSTGAAPEIAML
jgi:hypothetical protein